MLTAPVINLTLPLTAAAAALSPIRDFKINTALPHTHMRALTLSLHFSSIGFFSGFELSIVSSYLLS